MPPSPLDFVSFPGADAGAIRMKKNTTIKAAFFSEIIMDVSYTESLIG